MKKALLILGLLALGCQAFAQASASLTDILSSGTIVYNHMFGQAILPYLKSQPSSDSHETIFPKTHTVSMNMSVKKIIALYSIRPLDLSDAGNIMANLVEGNFQDVRFSTEKPNLIFVGIPHDGYLEEYVVNVFFSDKIDHWAIFAHDVNEPQGYVKGSRILTY